MDKRQKTIGSRLVSQKCRYALRAIFELALRDSKVPVKIKDIAAAQNIPPRFLEIILAELKNAGFVNSQRGNNGGYILARLPHSLTVGEIISFMQADNPLEKSNFELIGDLAFYQMWKNVTAAIADVYNNTTFADLIEQEMAKRKGYAANYVI